MLTLSHRERVAKAYSLQEPDRVPIDLMGHASMLLDETYVRLRDYLGLSPIPPIRAGSSASYYDERILDYLDIDFRRLFLEVKPEAAPIPRVVEADKVRCRNWRRVGMVQILLFSCIYAC